MFDLNNFNSTDSNKEPLKYYRLARDPEYKQNMRNVRKEPKY